MNEISQYDALLSLEKALVPSPALIDGRTEQDWLCFLAEFATLINFYDDDNNINGNWSPFLLKDPLFLLAAISKTRFDRYHSIYLSNTRSLQQLINKITADEKDADAIAFFFNRVFDELTRVFMEIKRWIYYMQLSAATAYPFKSWIIQQATNTYSKYFWAIINLRQALFLSNIIPGVNAVDTARFYRFGHYEESIWKQTKDATPYWDVLEMEYSLKAYPVRTQVPADILQALTKAGVIIYDFFHTIILNAGKEYESLKVLQNPYPDTTLLRAFVNLLQVQQRQLNGLTQKHLAFYYNNILQQKPLPAVADSVIICATLAKSASSFNLLAGTLFNAGIDAQKNPIFFGAVNNTTLTQASIVTAYTLAVLPEQTGLFSLNLQQIPAPNTVHTDAAGKVSGWDTFGSKALQPATFSFVIASPLLFLGEGTRTITMTLSTAAMLDSRLLANAGWHLSTATGWLAVTPAPGITYVNDSSTSTYKVSITFILDAKQPPLQAFAANNQGLSVQWPMLKIAFGSFADTQQPPVLQSVHIRVQVDSVTTFQLFNDSGALSTKTAFAPFGIGPALNSRFIIGSAEIFSKPLETLGLQLKWNDLPEDLSVYYDTYNKCLLQQQPPIPPPPVPSPPEPKVPWYKKLWNWIKGIFGCKSNQQPGTPLFNNDCFTAGFQLLENRKWVHFTPVHKISCTPPAPVIQLTGVHPSSSLKLFPYPLEPNVSPASCYVYLPETMHLYKADPSIQATPLLKFTDTSSSGFLKMELAGPVYGFGGDLYPGVVSYVSLYNAQLIYEKVKKPKFLPPAPLPFTPKLSGITAGYSASQTCSFTGGKSDDYPLLCYALQPFGTQTLFDNTDACSVSVVAGIPADVNKVTLPAGLPLYPSLAYNGYLFLQLANVNPGYTLNLYFELAGGNPDEPGVGGINFFYKSDKGWNPLPVLADSTIGLTCSGLVTVNIPGDIADDYWLAFTTLSKPSSFAQTVYVQTNGIEAQRVTVMQQGPVVHIPANTIIKTKDAVPQIGALFQPFASTGGKAAEDDVAANTRISQRLKTKDRAVTQEDYYRLVRVHFPDIYFSSAFVDEQARAITVCVARSINNWTDAGAFLPVVSKCRKEKIRAFLLQRANPFYDIKVTDFEWQYIQVSATVTLLPGFESNSVSANIAHSLNLYLSPWIRNDGQRSFNSQSLSNGQVSGFLSGLSGVAVVTDVSFSTVNGKKKAGPGLAKVTPLSQKALFVPGINHIINCKN